MSGPRKHISRHTRCVSSRLPSFFEKYWPGDVWDAPARLGDKETPQKVNKPSKHLSHRTHRTPPSDHRALNIPETLHYSISGADLDCPVPFFLSSSPALPRAGPCLPRTGCICPPPNLTFLPSALLPGSRWWSCKIQFGRNAGPALKRGSKAGSSRLFFVLDPAVARCAGAPLAPTAVRSRMRQRSPQE
ncbi:hypothetical protein A0H81_14138 [Grifola frondosa]|uniref:Uncharacterized protein n=1 Tax=Grifola frondosa TaxID=5627 RepID=A0A1C7LM30_GRIFR|nr:hypothetical protein A0H81_14138 [Grifola frondosa]